MQSPTDECLNLSSEELTLLTEVLELEQTKLLVEIRRTDHRVFRDELRRRLTIVERLIDRCHTI